MVPLNPMYVDHARVPLNPIGMDQAQLIAASMLIAAACNEEYIVTILVKLVQSQEMVLLYGFVDKQTTQLAGAAHLHCYVTIRNVAKNLQLIKQTSCRILHTAAVGCRRTC